MPQQGTEIEEPAWAPPAAEHAVRGRRPLTSKGRSWLLLLAAGCLVLMYVTIWTVYADTHMRDRFVQLPPGEPSAATVSKAQFRVFSMIKTERIDNPDNPDEPEIAEAGTIFVVAEIEVLRLGEVEFFSCHPELAVSGVRRIDQASGVYVDGKKLPTDCPYDEVKIGEPYRFLAIYNVPTRFADEIYGVAVEYTDYGAPYQVIRPPA